MVTPNNKGLYSLSACQSLNKAVDQFCCNFYIVQFGLSWKIHAMISHTAFRLSWINFVTISHISLRIRSVLLRRSPSVGVYIKHQTL